MLKVIELKIRESGMPVEEQWDSYFRPRDILKRLGLSQKIKDVVDFGSGYGTFTIPAAQMISGKIYTFDIEQPMIELVERKAKELNLSNVVTVLRDFISEGSGLKDSTIDFVMLFNILHLEKPTDLLKEAFRILRPGGKVGVIHWNYDPTTPRGPPMDIRPKPEQVRQWGESVGFVFERQLDLKPYHYAIIFRKSIQK
jgi:ubiquinone/menaquinone biosynthesis C-methylase UbiE